MSTEIFVHTFNFSRVLQVSVESVFYWATKALMKVCYSEQLLAVFSDVKYYGTVTFQVSLYNLLESLVEEWTLLACR